MMHRVLIEFVIDLPNAKVAKDVETRLTREHHDRMCETLAIVTGYKPLRTHGKPGLLVAHEPVEWSDAEQDWVGESDKDDDTDEKDGD